jgi:hypothetical protein
MLKVVFIEGKVNPAEYERKRDRCREDATPKESTNEPHRVRNYGAKYRRSEPFSVPPKSIVLLEHSFPVYLVPPSFNNNSSITSGVLA